MKEHIALRWIAAFGLAACVATAFASGARPEPNAFLNKRAESVPQLVQEVRTDDEVADRYARHFGKSRDEIVQYFSTLHLARINEDGTYMIYSVDDQGIIKARPQRLKAGTRVFADANGAPVLKASCGNAMMPGTNALVTSVSPMMSAGADTLRDVAVTTTEATAVTTETAEITPASPIALTPATPNQIAVGTSNQGFALPAVLGALGGAAGLLVGGGHANPPVPEPATVLVIVGGLAALKLRRKNK